MVPPSNRIAYRAHRVVAPQDLSEPQRLEVSELFYVDEGQLYTAIGEQLADELEARRLPPGSYVFTPEYATIEVEVVQRAHLTRVGDQRFEHTIGGTDRPVPDAHNIVAAVQQYVDAHRSAPNPPRHPAPVTEADFLPKPDMVGEGKLNGLQPSDCRTCGAPDDEPCRLPIEQPCRHLAAKRAA